VVGGLIGQESLDAKEYSAIVTVIVGICVEGSSVVLVPVVTVLFIVAVDVYSAVHAIVETYLSGLVEKP
jgi:hypothetical protein